VQVASWRDHSEELERLGAGIAFVSTGTPEQAANFRDTHAPGGEVLVDPERSAYAALGFGRSVVGSLLAPRVWMSGIMSLLRGHRAGRLEGDPWQLGGVALLRDGRVVRVWPERSSAARTSVEEVLAAVN